MKKFTFFATALLCLCMLPSCIKSEKEPETSTGIEDDGTGRIPTKSELTEHWQSNYYQGWEPRLEQDVVIARDLTLNSNGTYINRYKGHLTQSKEGSTLSTTEFGEWEKETGTWSYDSSTGTIHYNPQSDQRVNYDTQVMEDYDFEPYDEKVLLKTEGEYKGSWITIDQYLKRSGNKGDLRYALSIGSKID